MNHGLKYAGWALVGGAVGSTLAYLTAPASGAETRRRIARRVEDEKHELLRKGERAVEHAADYLEGQLKQGKRKLSQMVSLQRT
jgi:gas vesicle protein